MIEFCLLIPNIRPKKLNSVVKGARRALYDTSNPNSTKFELKIIFGVPTVIAFMIKKELDVYLPVPGNARKKTDSGRFEYHPTRHS